MSSGEGEVDVESTSVPPRRRGRRPQVSILQRQLRRAKATVERLQGNVRTLTDKNVQLQRRLDTRPPASVFAERVKVRSLQAANSILLESLEKARSAKTKAQQNLRQVRRRATGKKKKYTKTIRKLQRRLQRVAASSNGRTRKKTRKASVKQKAMRQREKMLAKALGQDYDELCKSHGVPSTSVGLVMTREGRAATVIRQPEVVEDDDGKNRWDPITDRAVGKAVWLVDEKTIAMDTYRSMQQLGKGVAPNAHAVGMGKRQLDEEIKELGVAIEEVGLDDHADENPAVVTTVSGLLKALVDSKM